MANGSRRKGGANKGGGMPESPRELVVMMRSEAEVAAAASGLRSRAGADTDRVEKILTAAKATIAPLFGASEERVRASMGAFAAASGARDPATFYRVDAEDDRLDDLAAALAEADPVEAAYVKPPASPASLFEDLAPLSEDAPPVTPDFTGRQGYLDAAPGGVDARWAWTQAGGRGSNVNIIDVEGAWRFTHEDLVQHQGGVVGGTQSTDIRWRNHGTAVVGVYGGDGNAFGVTGISPDAVTTAFSIFGTGNSSSAAIRGAASRMRAGDILLIELHRPGPRHAFASRDDQRGYIAVEWWPDDFAAILFATGRGVIVVEAAGNGAENLDDAIYNTAPAGFPASWRNPFNRANPDCGAVIVGAGAPATLNHGHDRSRLDFSNFGACVDAQGWGRDVCTVGYGDLQGGANEDLWYTARFSGTSSASPVVVGALACVQGILRARGAALLTPATARQRLRTTGSTQDDAPGRPATQRIGNRPNIRAIVEAIIGKTAIKDIIDVKTGQKDKVEKTEVKEKNEKTERKEIKEKLEFKEKNEKIERKEIKEKDKDKDKEKNEKIEQKEIKDKDKVEFKENKELEKRVLEKNKDIREGGGFGDKVREVIGGVGGLRPTDAPDLESRVAMLEAQLAHFIDPGLRPEVGAQLYGQAAGDESSRLEALRQEAEAQLSAAKQAKDMKDSEI
jgi:hypothetical protein